MTKVDRPTFIPHCSNDMQSDGTIAKQLLHAKRTELAVPIQLIEDNIFRSPSNIEQSSYSIPLLCQYAGARGYSCSWGHIIESTVGTHTIWRFIPLEIWNKTYSLRKCAMVSIPELISILQKDVRQFLAPHLPTELVLAGMHQNRRSPYALFSLLLIDTEREASARRWIAGTLLQELLPMLISNSNTTLMHILNDLHAALRKQ
ncbi:MAG: hypothetical protein V4568_19605 [Pseudomonadota bacterium]